MKTCNPYWPATALWLAASACAHADTLYALRTDDTLLRFDTRTPLVIDATVPVVGLGADQTLRSIDFRPGDRRLYGLGVTSNNLGVQLHRIDSFSGVATAIGPVQTVTPAAPFWCMDFDPTADRLRVLNNTGANLRLHPDTGAIVDGDAGMAGVQQDVTTGNAWDIRGCAHDRSFAGSAVSTLYGIDFGTDFLVRVGGVNGSPSPDGGSVATIGPLGITQENNVAFEIAGNTLHLAVRTSDTMRLYSVDIATGAATLRGDIGGDPNLRGLAVQPTIQLLPLVGGAGSNAGSLAVGERRYHAVSVSTNNRLWALADSGGPRNDAGASRTTSLRLLSPSMQTEIEQDRGDGTASGEDDTIEGGDAGLIAGRNFGGPGQHFLEVSEGFLVASNDDDAVSPYRLTAVLTDASTAEVENNDNAGVADPIGSSVGIEVRSGNISTADQDWYRITARAGDVLMIAVDGNPTRDAVQVDVQLLGPSPWNEVLLSTANSGNATPPNHVAEGFLFYAMRTDNYFVRVVGASAADYQVMVKTVRRIASTPAAGLPDEAGPLPVQALTGTSAATTIVGASLGVAGDIDHYTFRATAGARVWAYVDTGGPAHQSAGVSSDSLLTLLDFSGETTLEVDDDDGTGNGGDDTENGGNASVIAGRAVPLGTYVLRVSEFGDDQPIDPYRLFLFVTRGPESTEIEPNDTPALAKAAGGGAGIVHNGQIGILGDIDYYSVEAAADDVLFIVADGDTDRDGTGIDLTLRLYAPDGTTQLINPASGIDSSGASPTPGEGFNFRVIEGGRYYVSVAQRTNAATGAYRLMIDGPHLFSDGFEL